jgi:hypothetical protein
LFGNWREENHLKFLGVDGRIILRVILKNVSPVKEFLLRNE